MLMERFWQLDILSNYSPFTDMIGALLWNCHLNMSIIFNLTTPKIWCENVWNENLAREIILILNMGIYSYVT